MDEQGRVIDPEGVVDEVFRRARKRADPRKMVLKMLEKLNKEHGKLTEDRAAKEEGAKLLRPSSE